MSLRIYEATMKVKVLTRGKSSTSIGGFELGYRVKAIEVSESFSEARRMLRDHAQRYIQYTGSSVNDSRQFLTG